MRDNIKAFLIILLTCCMLLIGCNAEPETAVPALGAVTIDFSLPEGFLLNPQPGGNYELVRDGQVVGGLAKTPLTQADIPWGNESDENLRAYLESYVEPPLVMEYMAGSGLDHVEVEVSLIAYDIEAKKGHEMKHYLFERDGALYDLYLDPEQLPWETMEQILLESGLYLKDE